ncbi:RTA1 like protein-domain-containing protein [Talaromyces proteolyticus]|uniref:RTA1 like protein-domain-containing protein n=1 Tax=Talaromyces proteolyticus TaxID=1131652 RepID=A0AAD4KRK7_9EURO|nr:RTA1 like protein-domain-containing protein [Talaromyces proteolyticus]KAH8698854.1 RTA1 like protein-domain-containing protein [Talaromyces proteolyticus]
MAEKCTALTTPDTVWSFCPSIAGAYIMMVAFALTLAAHIFQAFYHRKWYCFVVIMAAIWQTGSYIFRILSIHNPASEGLYSLWFILLLVAPIWTNAFVYMAFGRMVWNFTDKANILGIKPWRFGMYFVILDIISFLVQIYGGARASQSNVPTSTVLDGLHIYMAGLGIQQFFILIFCVFAYSFHRTMNHEGNKPRKAYLLLYTVYAELILITTRIIFRLCEFSSGLHSTIPNHEAYQYLLDSLPMLIALVTVNIIHPGRIMPGKGGDMPSRKERKDGVITKHYRSREEVGLMPIPSRASGSF